MNAMIETGLSFPLIKTGKGDWTFEQIYSILMALISDTALKQCEAFMRYQILPIYYLSQQTESHVSTWYVNALSTASSIEIVLVNLTWTCSSPISKLALSNLEFPFLALMPQQTAFD